LEQTILSTNIRSEARTAGFNKSLKTYVLDLPLSWQSISYFIFQLVL